MISDIIHQMFEQIEKTYNNKKQQLIIEDVINIYEHKYPSYDFYVKCKNAIQEYINKKKKEFEMSNESYVIHLYVDIYIIEEHLFDYIFNLKKK